MPHLETTQFGRLDYSEDAVLEFPAGLPAFEDQTRFVLVEQPESAPAVFLQSLRRPELSFLTLPVRAVDPAYALEIPPEERAGLGFPEQGPPPVVGRELLCLVIVAAPAGAAPTANLMAPVVVSLAHRRGAQVLQPPARYSHQHPLLPPAQEPPCW